MSKTKAKSTRRKPKQARGAVVTEVMVILLFAVIALIVAIRLFYQPPQVDDNLPFDIDPIVTTASLPQTNEQGETINTPDVPVGPATTDDPVEYIRREGVYNFLIAGHDRVAVNTDVLIVASFDTKNNSLNLVQIPRDTYAEYTTDSYRKINGALSVYLNKTYYDYDKSMEMLMEFLMKNLNIKLDYYALIDLDILQEMVDAIGGVYLNVPADMDFSDPTQNLEIHLKAGPQTLNGEQAEHFVRFRYGYVQADIGRNDAQKIFMAAFLQQYKQNLNLSTLTKTVESMIKHVTTNLSVADCVFFAKEALELDMSKVVMVNMPGSDVRERDGLGQWYFVLSRAGALDAVNRFLNVYTADITDSIFDRSYSFSKETNAEFAAIYNTDIKIANEYNAQEVNQEGIYIPRT
ncbi:MAG: LCP family protein [Clostridia bacterium]|nr:LCP family protein [Clostridia bacterium]